MTAPSLERARALALHLEAAIDAALARPADPARGLELLRARWRLRLFLLAQGEPLVRRGILYRINPDMELVRIDLNAEGVEPWQP